MPNMTMRTLLRPASVLVLALAALSAHAALFDFESLATGTYTSVSQTVNGLTLGLSRTGGASFSVSDLSPFSPGLVPASYGSRTIDPFVDPGTSGFVGNLSALATRVSLEYGDNFQDGDTLTLRLYGGLNGTGALLGTTTGTITSTQSFGSSLSLAASGIQSFRLDGTSTEGSAFANSVYFDNINVTPVPEPSALAALGLGAVAVLRRRKRA